MWRGLEALGKYGLRMGRTSKDAKGNWLVCPVSCRGMRTEEGIDEWVEVEGIEMMGLMLVCLPRIQVDFRTNFLFYRVRSNAWERLLQASQSVCAIQNKIVVFNS